MNAIINFYNQKYSWCEDFFIGKSLCSLPIAGKPAAEYAIDKLAEAGIKDILLLDYNYDPSFAEKIGNGERWSVRLEYHGCRLIEDAAELPRLFSGFTNGEDLLVVNGPFVLYELNLSELANPEGSGPLNDCGVYFLSGESSRKIQSGGQFFDTLQSYFDCNFSLLDNPAGHVLPGYHVEDDVYTGMNTVLMPNCRIEPPVLLSDNTKLMPCSNLDGNVIIGANVIIDSGTLLKRCIVLDDTYVGRNLEFVDKIIQCGRIIDPHSGVFVELGEHGISVNVKKYGMRFSAADTVERLTGILLLLILFPFWLVQFAVPRRHRLRWRHVFAVNCYARYWQVARGKCHLFAIGADDGNFIFHFSETFSLPESKIQQTLHDNYYKQHRYGLLITISAFRVLFNRLLSKRENIENT